MSPEEIVADFKKRYENTYVFVSEPRSNESSLFHLERVEATQSKLGRLVLFSEDVGRITLNFGSAHTIKFEPAPVGVFQSGADAMTCRRLPARQWRRGICKDNTQIRPASALLARASNNLTFGIVADAFARKTYTFKASVSMMGTGKFRSIALDDNFVLCNTVTKSPDYILLYWEIPVARVSKEGAITQILEPTFTDQINSITSI